MKKFFKWLFILIGIPLIGVILYIWSIWPPTKIMSEEMVLWRLNGAMPKPTESEDPWVQRGEYLVKTAPCVLCHTPYGWGGPDRTHPLEGGMRVRWDVYGEAVSLNLTPDKETGIGQWSEKQFIVGMKTGIYPDGRVAHWQAMPWDMHSNYSLDDMRAIYRYLKSLPAAKRPPSKPIKEPLPEPDVFYYGR